MDLKEINTIMMSSVDYEDKDAPENLARRWVAEALHSQRNFSPSQEEVDELLKKHRPIARLQVIETLTGREQRKRAEEIHKDKLADLRAQKSALQNKPLSMNIGPEEARIEAEIRELIYSVDVSDFKKELDL